MCHSQLGNFILNQSNLCQMQVRHCEFSFLSQKCYTAYNDHGLYSYIHYYMPLLSKFQSRSPASSNETQQIHEYLGRSIHQFHLSLPTSVHPFICSIRSIHPFIGLTQAEKDSYFLLQFILYSGQCPTLKGNFNPILQSLH